MVHARRVVGHHQIEVLPRAPLHVSGAPSGIEFVGIDVEAALAHAAVAVRIHAEALGFVANPPPDGGIALGVLVLGAHPFRSQLGFDVGPFAAHPHEGTAAEVDLQAAVGNHGAVLPAKVVVLVVLHLGGYRQNLGLDGEFNAHWQV